MPHYAHENGCSTYLLFKSAPQIILNSFEPTELLGIRLSYQSIGQLWSDYLINKMIRLSSLISLSYKHISKMQHFIKILMRKADHFLKYFFFLIALSVKKEYMIDIIMSYDDTKLISICLIDTTIRKSYQHYEKISLL